MDSQRRDTGLLWCKPEDNAKKVAWFFSIDDREETNDDTTVDQIHQTQLNSADTVALAYPMKRYGKPTKNHWTVLQEEIQPIQTKGLQRKRRERTLTGNKNALWALRVKVQGSPYRVRTFLSSQGLHQ